MESTPVVIPASLTSVYMQADISEIDRANPLLTLKCTVMTKAGGNEWRKDSAFTWTGGSGFIDKRGVLNPPPSMTWGGNSLDNIRAQHVKVVLEVVGTPFAVGWSQEVI